MWTPIDAGDIVQIIAYEGGWMCRCENGHVNKITSQSGHCIECNAVIRKELSP